MILIIDDERREMDSYYMELDLSGYEVHFKTDVYTALKFFDDNLPSIRMVILDILMPPDDIFENSTVGFTEKKSFSPTSLLSVLRKY